VPVTDFLRLRAVDCDERAISRAAEFLEDRPAPVPREITVTAEGRSFQAVIRIGTPGEAGYRWHGGIMR